MKPKIALFVHQPKCSIQSCNGIIEALSEQYTFKIFTKHQVEDNFFHDVDCVCFPGGIGHSDSFDSLLQHNMELVRDYVAAGGKYIGICMGAYWADSNYFNILSDVNVVQYYKRPTSDTKRPHAKAMPVKWGDQDYKMYFYDGCTFTGNGNFQTIATYPNSDPMAIIQNNIGLIGCHPESERVWYDYHTWMPKHWSVSHHGLLLKFVNVLMEKV
jgi:glutamine amidotransferase-like uncharacterized protein